MRFRDFITLQRGFDLPKAKMREGPYPVVGSTSIIGYHDEFKVKPPGVVMGRSGSLGTIQFIREPYWPHNTSLWVKDFKGNDPLFVYYRLQGFDFARYNAGAGVPTLNRNHLDNLEVKVPPLPIQHRIAGILSAYDDLVENNLRRIKILEEMAQNLYREWIVNFRYPGHDTVPLVDSPLGQIPKGWGVKKLSDIAVVNNTQLNPRTAPDEIHYIDISSVSPGQIDTITKYQFDEAPGRARRVVKHGDILWSCVRPNRRSHALVMHPEANTIASTGFAVVTAVKVPFTYLYHAVTTDDFVAYLSNNATGAAYPAVTATTFEKASVIVPSEQYIRKFSEITVPISEQIHVLQRENTNLRGTRDLLLPRLLSSQIMLPDAETAQ